MIIYVSFYRVADALALLFLEEQTGFTTHLVAFISQNSEPPTPQPTPPVTQAERRAI